MPFSEDHDKLVTSGSVLVPLYAQKQRRRMLFALVLLLTALLLVFIRDWQFWFPSPASTESAVPAISAPATEPVQLTVPETTKPKVQRPKAKPHATSRPSAADPKPVAQAVISNRAVLPPLQVEVVAGDQHKTVRPGNPSINVELQPPSSNASPDAQATSIIRAPATDASERVRLLPNANQVVSNPVRPTYPTLARQMKVQGSVVLQALIGKSGDIQDLRVLDGPKILSSAAMEAVKQWHFKPYYQDGRPVETQCSITVNFTISTQ